MFSFFRKSRASKDQNADQRPNIGTSFDDASKAKVKSDRKSANKDRKIPFRSGTQPDLASPGDGYGIPAVIINNESSSSISYVGGLKNEPPVPEAPNRTKSKLRESESFDEFCEAQETLQQKILPELPDAEDCEFLEANETVQQHPESATAAPSIESSGTILSQQSNQQSESSDAVVVAEKHSIIESLPVAKVDERSKPCDLEVKRDIEPSMSNEISNKHVTTSGNIFRDVAPFKCNAVEQVPEQGSTTTRNIPIITVSCMAPSTC